jgi:hypothetical protein
MSNSKRYQAMIGNGYLYNGEQHTIQRIEPYDGDLVDIYTDKRRIRLTETEVRKLFLPLLLPVRSGKDTGFLAAYKENAKPMGDLIAKLDKLIDKIGLDPESIPQAKAVNETARSIILTWKTQIELLKVMKG